MKNFSGLMTISFAVSAAVHAGVIFVAGRQNRNTETQVPKVRFVSVRLDHRTLQPSVSVSRKNQDAEKHGHSGRKQSSNSLFEVKKSERNAELNWAAVVLPAIEVPPDVPLHGSSVSPIPSVAGQDNKGTEAVVAESIALPCRSLPLPRQWAGLKNVWPRRYKVEIRLESVSGNDIYTLTSLHPADKEFPALDARVRTSLTECLRKPALKSASALAGADGALNPAAGKAYSAEIEFYPESPNIAAQ
ncbi:MAG: hypothetical protein EBR09_12400 [Proteobacteria bacterium]|nr:hypothetical protein [Pseudomonadota bacterium]